MTEYAINNVYRKRIYHVALNMMFCSIPLSCHHVGISLITVIYLIIKNTHFLSFYTNNYILFLTFISHDLVVSIVVNNIVTKVKSTKQNVIDIALLFTSHMWLINTYKRHIFKSCKCLDKLDYFQYLTETN
jgi:hypothetical protein